MSELHISQGRGTHDRSKCQVYNIFIILLLLQQNMAEKASNYEDLIASEFSGNRSKPKLTKAGKIILGISGVSFCGICAATLPFLLPAARRICLPFVPATPAQVRNVFSLLNGSQQGRLIDLGSGDGRIVIEAARRGFQVMAQGLLEYAK